MTFLEFLKRQIQPCVFCFPTPELIKKVPDYESIVNNAWENAQSALPFPIRCVFPPSNEKLAILQAELVSVRENNFNSLFNNQAELQSMELIREYFFRQEFCNRFFFPDIPIGILIISHGSGPPNISEIYNSFQNWVNPFISKLTKAKLLLPSKNIKDPIAKYLNSQCIPAYKKLAFEIEEFYKQQWKGIQQRVAAFFRMQDELYNSILYLKLYADLCLQRGQYNEASAAYQVIIANSGYIEFTYQAQFCISLCDILSGNITQKSLNYVLLIKRSKLPYNQYFTIMLTELFLRIYLGSTPSATFTKFPMPRMQREKESDILFRPFLFEQIAALSEKHYFPLYLSNSAQLYNSIGAIKMAALCYRASIECFNGIDWPNIFQPLTEKTIRVVNKTEMNSLDLIVNVLNSKSLPFSKRIADLITNTLRNPNFQRLNHIQSADQAKNQEQNPSLEQKPNQEQESNSYNPYPMDPQYELPFPCGFVRARITNFYVPGYPCVQIQEIADEWKQTLERMFGAYRRQTFFDYNSLSLFQCCVGEEASVDVYLKFHGEIEISGTYLLVSGNSSKSLEQIPIIVQHQDKRKPKMKSVNSALPSSSSFSFRSNSSNSTSSASLSSVNLPSYSSTSSPSKNAALSTSLSSNFLKTPTNSNFKIGLTSSKKIKKVQIKFVPKVAGVLEIYGIGFIWNDVCRLESPFKHLPWKIKVLEPSARVDFTFSEVFQKVVVGQYLSIEVIAKNSSIPLDSFSLLIKGDVEASLIDPEIEEIFGQSKMLPLAANEERKITIGARFRKEGKYKLILIFPYWSKNSPPPRYGLKIYDFKVYSAPQLKIEKTISGVQIFSPPDSWALGFSGNIPTIDQHLVVVDGRLCLLDFVSLDTKDDEENEFILPNFCKKFIVKDEEEENRSRKKNRNKKLFFWYQNHYGIVQTQIECPETPVSIVLTKEGQLYCFYISNISGGKLENLSLSFGESLNSNSNDEYVYEIALSGLSKKVIQSLDINQTVVFKTHIFLFESHTSLPILLSIGNRKYSFYVYLMKDQF